jgi:hypothetical protein
MNFQGREHAEGQVGIKVSYSVVRFDAFDSSEIKADRMRRLPARTDLNNSFASHVEFDILQVSERKLPILYFPCDVPLEMAELSESPL